MRSLRGLVIKTTDIGEYDKLITLLTGETGVITARCTGVRRVKSKRLTAASELTYSEFALSENRYGYSVDEATAIEVFYGLRRDVETLALAQYLCELFAEFLTEGQPAHEPFRLLLNSLHLICTGKKENAFIKAVAELRLLSDTGFMPQVVACRVCGAYEAQRMYFDTRDGSIICEECNPQGGFTQLTPAVLKAVRYIVLSDFDKLFSFTLPPSQLGVLGGLTQAYLLERTGRSFKALEFYKSLL